MSEKKWKIWFQRLDAMGNPVGAGLLPYKYMHKSSAVQRAKSYFRTGSFLWIVSQENPFL